MQPTEVSPIAPGYRSITPYLMVDDVAAFLAFLRTAFDAQVIRQYDGPGGTIGHAEVRMADSAIMIGDPMGKHPRMPAALYYYVTNVDTVYRQALEAGAASVSEPTNAFYGDRVAAVQDKWDNVWWLATHVEDVSDDERKRRSDEKLSTITSNTTPNP